MEDFDFEKKKKEELKKDLDSLKDYYDKETEQRVNQSKNQFLDKDGALKNFQVSSDGRKLEDFNKNKLVKSLAAFFTIGGLVGLNVYLYPRAVRLMKKTFNFKGFWSTNFAAIPLIYFGNATAIGIVTGVSIGVLNRNLYYQRLEEVGEIVKS